MAMDDLAAPPYSLRARLLWLLFAVISLGAGLQGLMAYRTTLAEADEIFDYHMQQMALSLSAGLPMALPERRGGPGITPPSDDFVVQVWTASGVQVFQSAGQAALPQRAVLGFSEVPARRSTYRVFSVQTQDQVIQVAQDMAVRRQMARTLALRTVAPTALMAPILMLIVWWVVSRSLQPVSRVRRQLALRQADDLTPVSETGLPDEIRPLVHELNLLLRRVQQAFDAQKNFVADAAHELRSPLAALKLQVQGLQRASDEATRERAVGRLAAGIDRATQLVGQLLVLARQQTTDASGASSTRTVSLAALARQAVGDASPGAQARQIDLGLGHCDEATLQGDPDALAMLLRNLLDNAIKYTPPGGTVDLEIHARDGALHLGVDDSGPGIAEADRERVLDRFYRIPGNEATGSGLGLSIVKSVADRHHARLTLGHSARLGGLRVEVSFPAAPA